MPIITMPLGFTGVMLPELDFDEQIALCGKLGVTHFTLRPRIIPEDQIGKPYSNWGNHKFDLTPQRLVKEGAQIRKKLTDAGMTAFGTVSAASVEDDQDALKLHFDGAAAVGAGRLRVAPFPCPPTHFNYAEELDRNIAGFARVLELAKPYGLKAVIETHCRSIATSPALAWNICRKFDPDQIGTIFDLANFNIEGFVRPHIAVAVLDRYIDHCHVGGSKLITEEYDELGFRRSTSVMCPVTEANLHIPSWIVALHEAGRDVPLIIEDFTANRPGADRLSDSARALRRILESL